MPFPLWRVSLGRSIVYRYGIQIETLALLVFYQIDRPLNDGQSPKGEEVHFEEAQSSKVLHWKLSDHQV